MPELPPRPSLEYLRKLAKQRKRERSSTLGRAQFELAREYGFDSWPTLVHHIQTLALSPLERGLVLADEQALDGILRADPSAATEEVAGLPPLLVVLRRSASSAHQVRSCARLLLDTGADPDSHTVEWDGQGRM
ncbi:MAG: hypothetical protein ACREMA_18260, partial [Longimicrobiales bacterium]